MTSECVEQEQRNAPHHPTILIVEDDLAIGFVLAQALKEEMGARVLFATDGFQALKMLRVLRPTLCLLDYWLPQMNGLELAEQLRAISGCEQIPLVLMSANLPTQAVEARGLVGIAKPFDLDTLLDLVSTLLA